MCFSLGLNPAKDFLQDVVERALDADLGEGEAKFKDWPDGAELSAQLSKGMVLSRTSAPLLGDRYSL